MTNPTYEANERRTFHADLRAIESQSLPERQAGRADYLEAMIERPEIVAERVGWLLNGSYGYGSYMAAREVAANTRMNRVAWLSQTIASLEWSCPARFAISAHAKLTPEQKTKLRALIQAEIDSHLEGEATPA